MEKRIAGLFCFMLIICAILIGKIAVIDTHEDYVSAARNHSTYKLTLAKTRGKIYDRNKNALAGDASCLKALIIPSSKVSAELLGRIPIEKYNSLEDQLKGSYPFLTDVSDGSCECDGVTVYRVPKRYPGHSLAVHLVGICGKNGGESGIERAYDNWLASAEGELSVTCRVSASGRSLDGADREITDTTRNSCRGVMLTIDSNIQNIAETAAAKYMERGAVVVTDIETGEILAMASLPSYNQNDIAAVLNDKRSPLVNRAISTYNAGSVFKPVIAAAALENGLDPNEEYECSGFVRISDNIMGCIKHTQHGTVNLEKAISHSCNTYFINLSRRIGGDAIIEMAQKLGFGSETKLGQHYSSAAGILPDTSILTRPAELANLSFGQGRLMVTPIQIAGMTSAIARGGEYIEPYVVMGLTDEHMNIISQPYSPERHMAMSRTTARTLCSCMRTAVLDGTAKAGASDKISSAAKTGTAETGIIKNGKKINQAWYAGFFPYENPKYACVVLVENGTSGGVAAGPIFKEIAERISAPHR